MQASPYPPPAIPLTKVAGNANLVPFALPPSDYTTMASSQRYSLQRNIADHPNPVSPMLNPHQHHHLAKMVSSERTAPSPPIPGYHGGIDNEVQGLAQSKYDNREQDPMRRNSSYPFIVPKQRFLNPGENLERRARSDNGPAGARGGTMFPTNGTPHFERTNYGRPRGLSLAYRRDQSGPTPGPLRGPVQAVPVAHSGIVNFNNQHPSLSPGITGLLPYPVVHQMQPGLPAVMVNLPRQEQGSSGVAHPPFTNENLPLTQPYHNPLLDNTLPYNPGILTSNFTSLQGLQQESNQLSNPKIRATSNQGPTAALTESVPPRSSNNMSSWISDDGQLRSRNASLGISNDARRLEYRDTQPRFRNDARRLEYQDTQSHYKFYNQNRRLSENRGSHTFRYDPQNTYSTYENRPKAFRSRGSGPESRPSSFVQQPFSRGNQEHRSWEQSVFPGVMNNNRIGFDYSEHIMRKIHQNYVQSLHADQQVTVSDSEDLVADHQKKPVESFEEQQRGSASTESQVAGGGTEILGPDNGYEAYNSRLHHCLYQGQFLKGLQPQARQGEPSNTIYVGGHEISLEHLRQLFEPIGRVLEIIGPKLATRARDNPVPYNYGFIK